MPVNFSRSFIRSCCLATFSLLLGAIIIRAQVKSQPESKPVKLAVEPDAPVYAIGVKAAITIVIHDANNKPVKADKDYIIEIELRSLPSDRLKKKMLDTIRVGETAAKFTLPLDEVGILKIQAVHFDKIPKLFRDDTVIRVRPVIRSLQRPRPGAFIPGFDLRFGAGMMASPSPPQFVSPQGPLLIFKSSPQRTLLADGKDTATIHLFYGSEEGIAPSAIRVRLFSSGGNLAPQTPVIPQGEDYSEAKLTSSQVGTITVEFLGATPTLPAPAERQLQIKFGPPITQLDLNASPPAITLVDKSDLIVRLLNETGTTPIATDTARIISFAIEKGSGEIEQKELEIPAGRFEGRTSFLPTWIGDITISAATPDLQPATVPLKVTLPLMPLTLSALGGLAGGFIAFWTGKNSKWWRIAVGLITGFVLYWAFIFGVLNMVPRAIVLNPLSAFALSTLGGWLGTEVFTQLLKRLGLSTGGQSA